MKFAADRPFAEPEKAARKLIEIASTVEPVGIARAIANGWLWRHESGVYVKFTPAGAELFA